MQNTNHAHHLSTNGAFSLKSRLWALVCAVFVFAAVVLAASLAPGDAFADTGLDSGEYSIEEAAFTADIQTDGSLHVVERRIIRFERDHAALCWWINLPGGDSLESLEEVSVAQMSSVDQAEVQLQPLEHADYDPDWRKGEVPEGDVCSFDAEHGRTYAFFDVAGEYVLVQVEYSIQNAVQLYKDCAELRWKFVDAGQWSSASKNVSCSISFPVPADAAPVAGEDVYAWSHGPEGGGLSFDTGVNSVSLWEESVPADEYVEVRIMLPREWIANPTPEVLAKHPGGMRRDSILKEELEWVDHGAYRRLSELSAFIVFAVLSIALMAFSLILYALYGRVRKPLPPHDPSPCGFAKDASPAAVSRLWNWNRMTPRDFSACVMGLVGKGAVAAGLNREEGLYYLADTGAYSREDLSNVESCAMDVLFGSGEGRRCAVWVDDIASAAGTTPEELSYRFDAWHLKLDDQVAQLGYFESRGLFWQRAVTIVAVAYFGIAAVVSLALHSPWPAVLSLASCIAVVFVASQMGRRSERGSADYAACQRLRDVLAAKAREAHAKPAAAETAATGDPAAESAATGSGAAEPAELAPESGSEAISDPEHGVADPVVSLDGLSPEDWKLLAACAYAIGSREDCVSAMDARSCEEGGFESDSCEAGPCGSRDAGYGAAAEGCAPVPWYAAYRPDGDSPALCDQLEQAVSLVFGQASWKEQRKRAKQQKGPWSGRLRARCAKVVYTLGLRKKSERGRADGS